MEKLDRLPDISEPRGSVRCNMHTGEVVDSPDAAAASASAAAGNGPSGVTVNPFGIQQLFGGVLRSGPPAFVQKMRTACDVRELLSVRLLPYAILLAALAAGVLALLVLYLTKPPPPLCTTTSCLALTHYITGNMNTSIDPCVDFYQYACGQFPRRYPIPSGRTQTSVFSNMRDTNHQKLISLLLKPVRNNGLNSYERKLKHFFSSCIDEYAVMSAGARPFIDKVIGPFGGWYLFNNSYLSPRWNLTGALQSVHVDFWTMAFFNFYIYPDAFNPKNYIIAIFPDGWDWGLDYNSSRVRNIYRDYIRKVAKLLLRDAGLIDRLPQAEVASRVENLVADVLEVERKLFSIYTPVSYSEAFWREEKKTLDDLTVSYAPGLNWTAILSYALREAGVNGNTVVGVLGRHYIQAMSAYVQQLLASGDIGKRKLNNYLSWRLFVEYADDLSIEYVHASRKFYEARTGRKEFPSSFEFCYNLVRSKLSEAVAALYVQDHFGQRSKAMVHEMVGDLKTALLEQLPRIAWMDDATKSRAREKVNSIVDRLAYPEELLDDVKMNALFEKLVIVKEDYFQNVLNVANFERWYFSLLLSETPAENPLEDWKVLPWHVFLMYLEWENELLVPAGVMQYPVFHRTLPPYANLATLGSMLGNEVVQAVDEGGRHYLPNGTVSDWWSQDTSNRFSDARQCVKDHFSNVVVGPFNDEDNTLVQLDAERIVKFAIAEIGGLRYSYKAYQKQVARSGKFAPLPTGMKLNAEQLFFLSFAQINCVNRRQSVAAKYAKWGKWPEDVTMNKVLSQVTEFGAAFGCRSDAPMVAPKKCAVF